MSKYYVVTTYGEFDSIEDAINHALEQENKDDLQILRAYDQPVQVFAPGERVVDGGRREYIVLRQDFPYTKAYDLIRDCCDWFVPTHTLRRVDK